MKHEHTFALASLIHVFLVKIGPGDQVISCARSTRGNCSLVHGDHIVIFLFLFESKKVVSNLPAASFKLKN